MPIYEYACEGCGKTFEYLSRRPGDEPHTCPACGRPAPEKQLTGAFSASVKNAGGGCPSAGGHSCCGGCRHGH